jgi:manganese/zinc/iron transport system ATP- binding protein
MNGGIAIDRLSVAYGERSALSDITCTLPAHGFVAVVGPNGGGKSTLLKAIIGLVAAGSGTIRIDGRPAHEHRSRLAYLPQRDSLDLDFPATVELVAQMGRYPRLGMFAPFSADDHAAVESALDELGLSALRHRPLSALSGGQRQRTLLARALAQGAGIFLLDEPLNGLDAPTQGDLLAQLHGWGCRQGRLVIAAIHDLAAVRTWCTHAVVLDTRLVAAGPVAESCTDAVLEGAFGRPVA